MRKGGVPGGIWQLTLAWLCVAAAANCQETISPIYREVSNARELVEAANSIEAGSVSGGTIRLRPGMYMLDKPLAFHRNHYVNLVGSGWNTLLETKGPGNAVEFTDCWFCCIENLWIRQSGSAGDVSGIVFRGSSVCTVNRCRVDRFTGSGVRFDGVTSAPMSSNVVRDCWFQNNAGAQLYSHANNDFTISGNQYGTGASQAGCVLDHSSAGTYTMNFHWDNDVALKLGPGSHFNRIENNRFEESRKWGILIGSPEQTESSSLNIITGNTIHTNSKHNKGLYSAVLAFDAVDVVFTSNQVFSWNSEATRHKHALELGRGCERWIIKDNTLRHHASEALLTTGSRSHVIRDNIVLQD